MCDVNIFSYNAFVSLDDQVTKLILTSLSLATLQRSTGSRSLSVRLIILGLLVIMIPRNRRDTALSWPRRSSSSRRSTVTPRFTEPSHSSLQEKW